MALYRIIQRFFRCPRCGDDVNAAWWTDNFIDCAHCGIFRLSDCEEYVLRDR